mgnify:CR=1 FL=1
MNIETKLERWATKPTHIILALEVFNITKSQRDVLDWLVHNIDADATETSVTIFRGGVIQVRVHNPDFFGHDCHFTVSRRGKVKGIVGRAGPNKTDVPITTRDWKITVNIYSGESQRRYQRRLDDGEDEYTASLAVAKSL